MKDPLSERSPGGWTPRLYRPGDENQILRLYPLAFQGLVRPMEYWTWKFEENPGGQQQVVVGEDRDGRIIGHVAGLPTVIWAAGRQLMFAQVVDLMTAPEIRRGLRRAGAYITLLGAFIARFTGEGRAVLTFGWPNEFSDRIPQEVFGWQTLHQVIRVVRRLDSPSAIGPPWLSRRRYTVRPLDEFGSVVDPLWERCRATFPLATVRSARYLTWRYLRCPHVRYHAYVAWDHWRNRPAGLSVLRMGWEGQPLCAIVDWLVPRGDHATASVLLAHAETEARRAGMIDVAAWFPPGSPEQQWFLSQGYGAETTRYPLLAGSYSADLPLSWVARHWYYTMGDSDIF